MDAGCLVNSLLVAGGDNGQQHRHDLGGDQRRHLDAAAGQVEEEHDEGDMVDVSPKLETSCDSHSGK